MKALDFLNSANLHMNDRAATYDAPEGERSMGATVVAFNAITGHELNEEQGWMFMSILKKVRSQQGEYKQDSYEDDVAYAALAGEAAYRERSTSINKVEEKNKFSTNLTGIIPCHPFDVVKIILSTGESFITPACRINWTIYQDIPYVNTYTVLYPAQHHDEPIRWFNNELQTKPTTTDEPVEVVFRDGTTSRGLVSSFLWIHQNVGHDLISFRFLHPI